METLTIVRMKKDLLKKVKIQAAKEEKTIQEWVEEAVKEALKK